MAALDIYAKQEQWEKCLEVAAKQVSACVSPQGQIWGSGGGGQRGEPLQGLRKHHPTVPIVARQAEWGRAGTLEHIVFKFCD